MENATIPADHPKHARRLKCPKILVKTSRGQGRRSVGVKTVDGNKVPKDELLKASKNIHKQEGDERRRQPAKQLDERREHSLAHVREMEHREPLFEVQSEHVAEQDVSAPAAEAQGKDNDNDVGPGKKRRTEHADGAEPQAGDRPLLENIMDSDVDSKH